jgi:drug/metabolite transporter (DMT)-like permease
MSNSKLDPVYGVFYGSPVAIAAIFPCMALTEWSFIFERWRAEYRGIGILIGLILCGLVFALNIIVRTTVAVKQSPPFRSAACNAGLLASSTIGMAFFGNRLSFLSFVGTALATAGAWWHTQILLENRKAKPSELPGAQEDSHFSPQTSHAARRNV